MTAMCLSHPLWKGTASIGTELTFTRTDGTYSNDDQSHLSSDTRIRENNSAGFAEYDFTVGNFTFGAGLRFEHINSDYYSSGIREAEPSRTYNDWFPNASVAWQKDKWNWQLNYSRRINRPSYFQLRNFIQYDNRYTYEGGNPLLRPQLNHRLELSAIYSWLSLQVRYTYSQSTMCWVPVLEPDKRYILLCTRNYGDAQRLFASLVAAPRFGVYRPTVTLSFNKVFFDAEQYGSRLTHHRPLWRFELRNTFVAIPGQLCWACVSQVMPMTSFRASSIIGRLGRVSTNPSSTRRCWSTSMPTTFSRPVRNDGPPTASAPISPRIATTLTAPSA